MSDSDALDYLQPGFDPASLTVPRLRSILVAYDIKYPQSAKKPQLIEIFVENVLPQARKILSAHARAKRTSRGITDADSQDSMSLADEDLMPPPPTTRTRSTRKPSTRTRSEESESEPVAPRSPVKRSSRASSKHARAESETGTDLDGVLPKIRKTPRKSEATLKTPSVPSPEVKAEPSDEVFTSRPVDGSVFSYDNPFQSGSSPPSASRAASGERRRKSTPGSAIKDASRRKSTATTRRRTEGPKADDGFHPPTSATFEIPVSELNDLNDFDENGVEVSEEFTPEAQIELEQELATKGVKALGPKRVKTRQANTYNKSGPVWAVLLTLLCGYAFKYRQEKIAVGYCGLGRPVKDFVTYGVQTPEWAQSVVPETIQLPEWAVSIAEPQCEPCPQHAYCYSKFETRCEPDYVLKPHPLSLGGLVPVPPTCEPDGEKVRRVKAVADRAVEELRDRRAKWECGDLVNEEGIPEPAVEVEAEELKKEVSKKRRRGMGETEFEELWLGAIGEIQGREEVETISDGFFVQSTETAPSNSPVPRSRDFLSSAPSSDAHDSHWRDIDLALQL
ncbi:sister chromatid separation protein [Phlyctema vagabunda]|uniref:Sister chromatid separation protein n=1 Tax=Phlyctema vagabunda TaxID=108571 RepID=A0ABR4P6V5_9HELO